MDMEKTSASELERGAQGDTNTTTGPPQPKKSERRNAILIGVILGLSYFVIRGPLSTYHNSSLDQIGILSKGHGHGHHHQDQDGCPYQPDPLHPRLTWNVTDEEKAASVDHFSQAVVSRPSLLRNSMNGHEMEE